MPTLKEIEAFCDPLLDAALFSDASFNGIQVERAGEVDCLATGVTASEALIRQAVEAGAGVLLVHHGIFWQGQSPVLRGGMYKRARLLLRRNVGLLAYHLPLDAHPELGNNALLAGELGLSSVRPWGEAKGPPIGVCGTLDPPRPAAEVVGRMAGVVGRDVLHFAGDSAQVRRVAIVTGSAARMALSAARQGIDLFLTGEPSEGSMHLANEEGIHFVAAGHHATERFGVRALGDRLQAELGLRVVHLDLPNPV